MMRAAARKNSLLNTRLSEISPAVHSSVPPTKRSHQAVWFYQCWMITPITAFSLTAGDKCLQMERQGQREVELLLMWGGHAFTKLKLGGGVVEAFWQGLGCDGETPSLLFPILSHTPPIIAGLTVSSRAGLCGWAMGTVSFLPSPGPVDWFPWQEHPPPTHPRSRKRE